MTRMAATVLVMGLLSAAQAKQLDAQGRPFLDSRSSTAVSPQSTLVAVVDLRKVFDGHESFRVHIEAVQRDARLVESELSSKQKELASKNAKLRQLQSDTAAYLRLESELAHQAANLQVLARQKQKELMQAEAQHYYQAYREILDAVARVAQRHAISLVLRVDHQSVDDTNLRAVAQEMARPVVIEENLDITQQVLEELHGTLAQKTMDGVTRR